MMKNLKSKIGQALVLLAVAGSNNSYGIWPFGQSAQEKPAQGHHAHKPGAPKREAQRPRGHRMFDRSGAPWSKRGLENHLDMLHNMCPGGDAKISELSPTWAIYCSDFCNSSQSLSDVLRAYVSSAWLHEDDVKAGKTTDKNYKEKRACALVMRSIEEIRLSRVARDLKAYFASKEAKTEIKSTQPAQARSEASKKPKKTKRASSVKSNAGKANVAKAPSTKSDTSKDRKSKNSKKPERAADAQPAVDVDMTPDAF